MVPRCHMWALRGVVGAAGKAVVAAGGLLAVGIVAACCWKKSSSMKKKNCPLRQTNPLSQSHLCTPHPTLLLPPPGYVSLTLS